MTAIRAVLDALANDLRALTDVRDAQVWQGEWEALASGRRLSFRTPAALVSLIEFGVIDVAQAVAGHGRLAAADPPRRVPAAGRRDIPFAPDGVVRATVEAEIAVTCVAGGSGAAERAAESLDLAARAVPVLVRHALRDIVGSNLQQLEAAGCRVRRRGALGAPGSRARSADRGAAGPERRRGGRRRRALAGLRAGGLNWSSSSSCGG